MGHPTGRERREHGLAARLDDCLDRAGALLTDEAFSAWADDWEALLDEVEALERIAADVASAADSCPRCGGAGVCPCP